MSEPREFIKFVWKSAHAVNDFPGKWTIRRFSPFKKVCVVGEGATEELAWKNAESRITALLEKGASDGQ